MRTLTTAQKRELKAIRDRLRPDGWRVRVLSDCPTGFNIAEQRVPLFKSRIFRLKICPDGEWEIEDFYRTGGLVWIGVVFAVRRAVSDCRES
jgi:hypothetical protein